MANVSYAWAPITKSEVQDDGTVIVYGPAASSALDRDNQRLSGAWLDVAMPRWLAEGGGVREQHDPKRAVGVGVGLSKGDDGAHLLTAKIVDPVAVKKIEHGVLRGFSVGIKNPKVEMGKADAPNGLVVDGEVIEVSVCDRPANPGCTFALAKADDGGALALVEDPHVAQQSDAEAFGLPQELYDQLAAPVREALAGLAASGATVSGEAVTATKADTSAAGRQKAAADGAAMPDGSYPIQTKADLRKAVRAVGRGGSGHDAIRKHIIKRAAALGLEALVPDNWNSDGSLKTVAKAEEAERTAQAEQLLCEVRALVPGLVKADNEDAGKGANGESEAADISGAEAAIACIARLIIAEAESLAAGNLNEACDIALLLDAVRSLSWFKDREDQEQDDDGDTGASLTLADTPDTAKAHTPAGNAAADAPVPQTPGTPPVPDTLTKADITELVKAAVAEAEAASKERTAALEADLAKANAAIEEFRALPAPGGPALTRTAAQQAQARSTDAVRLRAEASGLLAKAEAAVDPVLRRGYQERATELLEKADA
ncbi:hypothetical protein AB0H73_14715 [Streptomyces olivoreticuli]